VGQFEPTQGSPSGLLSFASSRRSNAGGVALTTPGWHCYAKNKNVPEQFKGTPGYGDVWTFTAICADTKLVPSWLVGSGPQTTPKSS
jgi:hypothetical protein